MANITQTQGLVPYGELERATVYQAGGTVYVGAPVTLNSSGQVVAATASDTLLGAALSSAVSGADILVADALNQRFIVQATGSAVDAQTDIGNVANLVINTANATYKIARAELDDATLSATVSEQVQLLAVEAKVGNAFGSKVKCIVRINKHQLAPASSGV